MDVGRSLTRNSQFTTGNGLLGTSSWLSKGDCSELWSFSLYDPLLVYADWITLDQTDLEKAVDDRRKKSKRGEQSITRIVGYTMRANIESKSYSSDFCRTEKSLDGKTSYLESQMLVISAVPHSV